LLIANLNPFLSTSSPASGCLPDSKNPSDELLFLSEKHLNLKWTFAIENEIMRVKGLYYSGVLFGCLGPQRREECLARRPTPADR